MLLASPQAAFQIPKRMERHRSDVVMAAKVPITQRLASIALAAALTFSTPNYAALADVATPTDVAVTVKEGTIDLKAKKLPSSVGISLPFVGSLRANIKVDLDVQKVKTEEVAKSDVVISLPRDLIGAGKLALGGSAGAALDVPGLVSERFDLDLKSPGQGEADIFVTSKPGKAEIALTSKRIPKLPLPKSQGLGRFCDNCGNGAPKSDWYIARNLGDGVQFYSNPTTGESRFTPPPGF
jgi:hypothetical protein